MYDDLGKTTNLLLKTSVPLRCEHACEILHSSITRKFTLVEIRVLEIGMYSGYNEAEGMGHGIKSRLAVL